MSQPPDKVPGAGGSDPFDLWRQIYEANEQAWNATLERTMAAPGFAAQQGKMLETFLAAQKNVRDGMRTYLETINVPSRDDVSRLGELIVGLEEKVDQLADELDERLARIEAALTARDAEPKRTAAQSERATAEPARKATAAPSERKAAAPEAHDTPTQVVDPKRDAAGRGG